MVHSPENRGPFGKRSAIAGRRRMHRCRTASVATGGKNSFRSKARRSGPHQEIISRCGQPYSARGSKSTTVVPGGPFKWPKSPVDGTRACRQEHRRFHLSKVCLTKTHGRGLCPWAGACIPVPGLVPGICFLLPSLLCLGFLLLLPPRLTPCSCLATLIRLAIKSNHTRQHNTNTGRIFFHHDFSNAKAAYAITLLGH